MHAVPGCRETAAKPAISERIHSAGKAVRRCIVEPSVVVGCTRPILGGDGLAMQSDVKGRFFFGSAPTDFA